MAEIIEDAAIGFILYCCSFVLAFHLSGNVQTSLISATVVGTIKSIAVALTKRFVRMSADWWKNRGNKK